MTTCSVFVTTQFEGFHCWPDAPDEVAFLRDRHRHIFHVRMEWPVMHDDREFEFILLKRNLDQCIAGLLFDREYTRTWSCEQWARELIAMNPPASSCEVSEDGENGARVA
jgi:hypothetical protein